MFILSVVEGFRAKGALRGKGYRWKLAKPPVAPVKSPITSQSQPTLLLFPSSTLSLTVLD
jgi:hypothetical protein